MGSRKTKFAIAILPGATLMAIVGMLLFNEWIQVWLISNQRLIGDYHFGSETMISLGGSRYQSVESYARSALIWSLACLSGFGMFVFAFRKRNPKLVSLGYVWSAIIVIGLVVS